MGFRPLLVRAGIGLALGFALMAAWNLTHPESSITQQTPSTENLPAKPPANLLNPLDFQGRAAALAKSGEKHSDGTLARDWLEKDPDGAIAWLQSRPATFENAISLDYLAREYLDTNLALARRVIEIMPRSAKRGRLDWAYVVKLAETDSESRVGSVSPLCNTSPLRRATAVEMPRWPSRSKNS